VTKKSALLAYARMEKVLAALAGLDAKISAASKEYQFDRISSVEKNALRLGAFEMLCDDEVPPKVAIAEAIRLCRKFATAESAQFVNAILDGVGACVLKSD
jgi:N utilization substance protein B